MNSLPLLLTAIVVLFAYVVFVVLPAGPPSVDNVTNVDYAKIINTQKTEQHQPPPEQVQSQPQLQNHPPTVKNPYKDLELVSVVILTRHGDRTPLKTFPGIKSEWKELGILTPVGAKQHRELGAKYRERYDALIGKEYDHTKIYARATNKNRTIESAHNFFEGLMGKSHRDQLKLIIPNGKEDFELYAYKNCGLLKKLRKAEHQKEYYQSKVRAAAPYLADLSDILKVDEKISFGDTSSILNIIQAEKIHNQPTTDAIANNQTLMQFVRESGTFVLKNKFPTQQMGFYGSRFLLKHILHVFKEHASNHKFTFLSGHDGTIICLFAALDVKEYTLPAYAGSVAFEFRRNTKTNEEFVVLYYSTSHEHLADEPFLVWPIADFANLVSRANEGDWEAECNPNGQPIEEPHGSD